MISWSYSRIQDFEACPLRFKMKYLDKLQETTSDAALRGTSFHKRMEAYLRGETNEYPCEHFQGGIDYYKEKNPIIEEMWTFDEQWELCDSKTAWVRMIPDFYWLENDVLYIHDFKTGKKNSIKHTAQGQLYAIGGYLKFQPKTIGVQFMYLDSGDLLNFTVKPDQIPTLQKTWTNRALLLSQTQNWRPKPTKWNCKWCSVQAHCDYRYDE